MGKIFFVNKWSPLSGVLMCESDDIHETPTRWQVPRDRRTVIVGSGPWNDRIEKGRWELTDDAALLRVRLIRALDKAVADAKRYLETAQDDRITKVTLFDSLSGLSVVEAHEAVARAALGDVADAEAAVAAEAETETEESSE